MRWALLLTLALGCDDGDPIDVADIGADARADDVRRPRPSGDTALPDATLPTDGAMVDGGGPDGRPGPPEPVIAVLEAPASVGACEVLVLDASLSTGHRLRFAWTVDAPAGSDEALTARASATPGPVLIIPASMLRPETTYGFAVTASDREGHSDTVRVEVSRAALPAPAVHLLEGEHIETSRGRPLTLHGEARAVSCTGEPRAVAFGWAADPVLPEAAEIQGAVLDLPPGVLEPGESYVVTFSAWLVEAPDSVGHASIEVEVLPGALQPAIAGGDREHPIDRDLRLDASASRDPDAPGDEPLRAADGYGFEWRCEQDEGACDLQLAGEPMLTIPARALTLGGHVFTLRLSHGDRVAEAQADVKIVEALCHVPAPPVVAIAPPAEARVDPRRELRLRAAIAPRGEEAPTLSWREATGQLDLGSREVAPAGDTAPTLLVVPGALEPGASLRFRLEASDCAGVGADELAVDVNAPPRGGGCAAEAAGGLTAIRCEGFVDDDGPLSYAFAFEREGLRIPLAPAGPSPELVVAIPPGVGRVFVTIRDGLGLPVEVVVRL